MPGQASAGGQGCPWEKSLRGGQHRAVIDVLLKAGALRLPGLLKTLKKVRSACSHGGDVGQIVDSVSNCMERAFRLPGHVIRRIHLGTPASRARACQGKFPGVRICDNQ